MEIMAWADGTGSCFVTLTAEEDKRVREILELPFSLVLVTVLPFGYRPDDFKGRGRPRRPLEAMVHEERFGNRIEV
jgi:nitroreductase